jgi:hypothetical protein
VYFLSAAVASQWRNIVRLFEGYLLTTVAHRPIGKTWHQRRMDKMQNDTSPDPIAAYYLYPPENNRNRVLPTRLGNILLSGERYAKDRYGIDTIIFWPRLYPLLPEGFQRDYEASIIQYQFPLVVAFEASVATAICAFTLLLTHASAWTFLAVLFGGAVGAYAAYLLSLSSAIEMAEQQRSAFDLFRGRLLIAWPAFRDVRDENDTFGHITDFVVTGFQSDWDVPRDAYVERWRDTQGPA